LVIKTKNASQDVTKTGYTYYTTWVESSDISMTVSKSGFENYNSEFELKEKTTQYLTLKPVKRIRQTIDGKVLVALAPEKGSEAKMIKL
jgi:predicted N-acyltransferase